MDFQLGRRWTLRPDDGPVPWWIFDAARRVPGTHVRDYLVLLTLMRRHPGRRIGEIVRRDTVLWEKFLRPVLLSALNTAPEEASADLAGAIVRETLAKGGRHMEPLVASPKSRRRLRRSGNRSVARRRRGHPAGPLAARRQVRRRTGGRVGLRRGRRDGGRGGLRGPGGAALDRPEVAAGHGRTGYIPRHPERPFPHRPAIACASPWSA